MQLLVHHGIIVSEEFIRSLNGICDRPLQSLIAINKFEMNLMHYTIHLFHLVTHIWFSQHH
jgi:hypothetical protein